MFRLCLPLVMLPACAFADGPADPAMFSYEAAFDACTLDPTAPDLATHCDAAITTAYLLRRAVTRATVACADTPLETCTLPFEDEGLPAVAMQIAAAAGCDNTPPPLPENQPLDENHCITLAANIMEEEGVVPLETLLPCDTPQGLCAGLHEAQSRLWQTAIADLSDTNLTTLRIDRVLEDCRAEDDPDPACHLPRLAAIWAELAQIEQEN